MDLPLVVKMILMYIWIIAIPMILLGINYIVSIGGGLERQYAESKKSALLQSADFIKNELGIVEFCTSCIQYNNGVLEYIEHQDFSTSDGVAVYMETVRPAFEQLKSINGHFESIRAYRMLFDGMNDIHYVLNASDQPNLDLLGAMNLRDLRLFIELEEGETVCRLYKVLYNGKYTHQIGYTEVVAPFDELFGSLGFFGEDECVVVGGPDGRLYRAARSEGGGLYLEPCDAAPQMDHCEQADIEQVGIRLIYCFNRMQLLSAREMITCIAFVVTMLLLLVVLFLITYRSITRRIANFTNHLRTSEPLKPYEGDPYRDEIGQMVRRFNKTIVRQNQLTEEIRQKELLVGQAQYYALQSQIQPHFLYNTLENIDMLIAMGQGRTASKMIALFGKILRYNVSRSREKTTLGSEMDHISDYLKLYAFRMSESFAYRVEMPPELRDVSCPYCMLQPLIENCFKHGFLGDIENPFVHITAYEIEDRVEILIRDNGQGADSEQIETLNRALQSGDEESASGESIGLRNVNNRIRFLCGKDCGLRIAGGENGFSIVIKLRNARA
ncbi:MAG: histidine kinase [Clostridia bacterium]|nr:histidine kinase [Clostridia bacterium]